jgi:hypothetical protein
VSRPYYYHLSEENECVLGISPREGVLNGNIL